MSRFAAQKSDASFLPSWAANLIGFGLLTAIVIAIFFQQQITSNKNLQKNSFNRSLMVAGVIEKNLNNASAAQETIDTLAFSFLQDNARFIAYLDTIDPLQSVELEALAKETGLLGITIHRSPQQVVDGPAHWNPRNNQCSGPLNRIYYDLENRQALLNHTTTDDHFPCIALGIDASAIFELRQTTGLPALFKNLSALPGIHYVRLEKNRNPKTPIHGATLINTNGTNTAETQIETKNGTLVVGLDAGNFIQRRAQLRKQFILFASLLFILALFFSWIIYRKQQAELQRTRHFERMLAKEHESAALGRATATIAHEVRNPLNAINMGLQRLTLESDNLEPDQLELISTMGEAVRRTSNIVKELQRYTKKLQPVLCSVNLEELSRKLFTLYSAQTEAADITIATTTTGTSVLQADRDLLYELLENLLKNSIEAQPQGGFIHLELKEKNKEIHLHLTNGGFTVSSEQAKRLGEPYFTTKTRGSGLGLALCRRIAEAHDGWLEILPNHSQEELTISLRLPTLPTVTKTPQAYDQQQGNTTR